MCPGALCTKVAKDHLSSGHYRSVIWSKAFKISLHIRSNQNLEPLPRLFSSCLFIHIFKDHTNDSTNSISSQIIFKLFHRLLDFYIVSSLFFLSTFYANTNCLRSRCGKCRSFLSTFPRRERPTTDLEYNGHKIFLSTFPRRERHRNDQDMVVIEKFLSTFPRRERPNFSILLCLMRYFYPRSHVGNDRVPLAALWQRLHFYPRSHVGNDKLFSQLLTLDLISIHVPT